MLEEEVFESLSPHRSIRKVGKMVDKQMILESVGPVQAILDAHDGVVNVIDTTDGVIMISLEGGCTGCSATPMTAMQIYYSLMKLKEVEDVIFVNGELPAYMRSFIDDKLTGENKE
ncbi:MAG: Fe-S cluster biogenesis protein NfuA [Candidatus Thalassarchaeaceae archaeon]|jgi:Fe-S cluster biogenesis protein NfuA|tara:strand:+ start:1123 stop:1470 length:348 start_codon:yes stop_codon:yes gene_type:complete